MDEVYGEIRVPEVDDPAVLAGDGRVCAHSLRSYPRLREQFAVQGDRDPEKARDEDFRYGLEVILDGLESRGQSR